jgi:hypothetical protein
MAIFNSYVSLPEGNAESPQLRHACEKFNLGSCQEREKPRCRLVSSTMAGWRCNKLEKYESQWEGLSHLLWKIKHVPTQPDGNLQQTIRSKTLQGGISMVFCSVSWELVLVIRTEPAIF